MNPKTPKQQTPKQQTIPLFEIFIRSKRGLDHRHVGSLHAEDSDQALDYARDVVQIQILTKKNSKSASANFQAA